MEVCLTNRFFLLLLLLCILTSTVKSVKLQSKLNSSFTKPTLNYNRRDSSDVGSVKFPDSFGQYDSSVSYSVPSSNYGAPNSFVDTAPLPSYSAPSPPQIDTYGPPPMSVYGSPMNYDSGGGGNTPPVSSSYSAPVPSSSYDISSGSSSYQSPSQQAVGPTASYQAAPSSNSNNSPANPPPPPAYSVPTGSSSYQSSSYNNVPTVSSSYGAPPSSSYGAPAPPPPAEAETKKKFTIKALIVLFFMALFMVWVLFRTTYFSDASIPGVYMREGGGGFNWNTGLSTLASTWDLADLSANVLDLISEFSRENYSSRRKRY